MCVSVPPVPPDKGVSEKIVSADRGSGGRACALSSGG